MTTSPDCPHSENSPSPRILLARHGQPVPRYTSYPTAPHFTAQVDAAVYAGWLGTIRPGSEASVYLHVPFCAELCLYCGCQTAVARSRAPVKAYADRLVEEIALVRAHLPDDLKLTHLHFGGGTPTMLEDEDFTAILAALRAAFRFSPGAEIAIEIDPRVTGADKVAVLARHGFTRASLGVQDLNPKVQEAIGRHQSEEETAQVAHALRAAGIHSVNLDLMYGLPYQDLPSVRHSVEAALKLEPDRVAVFGYAHVPWMKKHQVLIPEAALPGPEERFAQAELVAQILTSHGYRSIGLDHFARADDSMARQAEDGTLKRNFQGYTTDAAPVLLGFGASSIGALPQGYVQNIPSTPLWHQAVGAGRLPVARGVAVTDEDRLRRAIIERLMCDLRVDLAELTTSHGFAPDVLAPELEQLGALEADGLVRREGQVLVVPEAARAFTRVVCAVFDAYLARARKEEPQRKRHAAAV